MILVLILDALFALSILSGKMALPYTTPIFLTGIRMFLGGLALLGYEYFHPQRKFKFHKEHLKYYIQLVLFGVYITYVLRFWALKYMAAYKTSFIYNLSPFLTSFYCYLFFNEKLTKKQWLGLIIGLLGCVPILIAKSPVEAKLGEFLFISWPELAVLISVATASYNWVVMRTLVRDHHYSPITVNGISMTAGGLFALLTFPIFETYPPVNDWLHFSFWLVIVIITSNIICHNLYGYLLRRYSATLLSFAGFAIPFFTLFYEWILLGVTITWHFYLSSLIVFFGLVLFYRDELRSQPILLDETPEA